MAARRLIIILISLLVISSIAAALIPVERDALDDDTTTTTTTAPPPPPPSRLVQRTIDAGRAVETIRISLGDRLVLRVRVERPDEIQIPALGQLQVADPDAPARFDLIPDNRGTYGVRLVNADRRIARIRVGKRAKGSGEQGGAEAGASGQGAGASGQGGRASSGEDGGSASGPDGDGGAGEDGGAEPAGPDEQSNEGSSATTPGDG